MRIHSAGLKKELDKVSELFEECVMIIEEKGVSTHALQDAEYLYDKARTAVDNLKQELRNIKQQLNLLLVRVHDAGLAAPNTEDPPPASSRTTGLTMGTIVNPVTIKRNAAGYISSTSADR